VRRSFCGCGQGSSVRGVPDAARTVADQQRDRGNKRQEFSATSDSSERKPSVGRLQRPKLRDSKRRILGHKVRNGWKADIPDRPTTARMLRCSRDSEHHSFFTHRVPYERLGRLLPGRLCASAMLRCGYGLFAVGTLSLATASASACLPQ